MEKWRKVWAREEVQAAEELVLPVAVDERAVPQDWLGIIVQSCVAGEKLGVAKRLVVQVHDAARRASTAQRIARNLDVLVRGVGARVEASGAQVEFAEAPECRVGSQRVLCALGVLMRQVGLAAKAPVLEVKSESYVPDVGCVLRAVFAHVRKELGERGLRDVEKLLGEGAAAQTVLRMLGTVPSVGSRPEGSVAGQRAGAEWRPPLARQRSGT